MKNPCSKDCRNRSPTCHAECPEYMAFYNANRLEDKKRIAGHEAGNVLADYNLRYARTNNKARKVREI